MRVSGGAKRERATSPVPSTSSGNTATTTEQAPQDVRSQTIVSVHLDDFDLPLLRQKGDFRKPLWEKLAVITSAASTEAGIIEAHHGAKQCSHCEQLHCKR